MKRDCSCREMSLAFFDEAVDLFQLTHAFESPFAAVLCVDKLCFSPRKLDILEPCCKVEEHIGQKLGSGERSPDHLPCGQPHLGAAPT